MALGNQTRPLGAGPSDKSLLAEEWSSEGNKNRDESFPLSLLSSTGRFDRRRLGRLF